MIRSASKLHDLGQSLWLDNVTRELLNSGTLQRYIEKSSRCWNVLRDQSIALHPKTEAATSSYTEFAPRRGQSVCYVFVRAFSARTTIRCARQQLPLSLSA